MKTYDWRRAINKSNLPPTTKHLLQTISDHLNPETKGGGCFPSQKKLAEETGFVERTIIRHLKIAAGKDGEGWIRIVRHGRRNYYYPQIPGAEIGDTRSPISPEKVTEDHLLKVTEDHLLAEIGDTRSPISPEKVTEDHPNKSLILNKSTNTISDENSDSDVIKIKLPTKEGIEFPISETKVKEWEETYPNVHVPGTLLEIRQWLRDNPKHRWPAEEMLSHVNGWMARVQNPPPSPNGYKGNGKQGGYYAQR
jgi:Helix-turn-helix domain